MFADREVEVADSYAAQVNTAVSAIPSGKIVVFLWRRICNKSSEIRKRLLKVCLWCVNTFELRKRNCVDPVETTADVCFVLQVCRLSVHPNPTEFFHTNVRHHIAIGALEPLRPSCRRLLAEAQNFGCRITAVSELVAPFEIIS